MTVTGVAPDTESVATITTQRDGYVDGSNTVSETALKAAQTPQFTSPIKTPDGFTVRITNYDTAFDWTLNATNTTDTVEIDGTGLVTVTGVAPGTSSRLRVTTTRNGHADGQAEVGESSVTGPALTPEFGPATSTASGFTVQIQNNMSGFTWAARSNAGTATISGQVVTVTGLAADQTATVTVTTSRSGYADGSATASGSALSATVADNTKASAPAAPAISRIDLKKKGKASVYYTPGSDGGAPILGATATCKPVKKGDTRTATGTSAPLKIKKLKKKASYKCTVSVINAVGASPASAKKTIKAK